MCADGIQQVREDQALGLLRQVRIDYPQIHPLHQHGPEEFLALLERRTGILIQSGHTRHNGHSVPVYEFRHLTLQEYLAGIALLQRHYRGLNPGQTLAEAIAPLAGKFGEAAFGELEAPDTVVVENWREALRLCIAACTDHHAVDAMLLAILSALPEETGTARPRAVMAALCLADEPYVTEPIAAEILQTLAAEVREGDGSGHVRSSLDAAAMELAASHWSKLLGSYLLDEFFRQETLKRTNPGGLFAMVDALATPQEEDQFSSWLLERATLLHQCNEREAARIALAVMGQAYAGRDCRAPGLADDMTRRLSGSPPMTHAAAWALRWMNHPNHSHRAWKPEPEQLNRLLAAVEKPDCDCETTRWLSWIFGNLRATRAIPPLLYHLPISPLEIQRAIVETLGELGDLRGVVVAKRYLRDTHESMRRSALGGLAFSCQDEIDRKLLEEDISDALWPLDPRFPITATRIAKAAEVLNRPPEEIRQRYERLAERFGLTVE